MVKYALFALGIAAVVAMGIVLDAQSSPPAVRQVGQAEEFRIFALGRVEGITSEIELRSQLTGRIAQLPIKEGQFVEQGEVLLVLDAQQHQFEVALATAEVELARATLDYLRKGAHPQERAEALALYQAKSEEFNLANRAWERIRQLIDVQAVSQQKADDQRGEMVVLSAELAAAKARLDHIQAEARPEKVRMDEARIQAAEARLELA